MLNLDAHNINRRPRLGIYRVGVEFGKKMMQRFKAAVLARHQGLLSRCRRGLCSLPDTVLNNDDLDHQVNFPLPFSSIFVTIILYKLNYVKDSIFLSQVMVEGKAWSRTAILNRPSVLNALTTAMVCSSFIHWLFSIFFLIHLLSNVMLGWVLCVYVLLANWQIPNY